MEKIPKVRIKKNKLVLAIVSASETENCQFYNICSKKGKKYLRQSGSNPLSNTSQYKKIIPDYRFRIRAVLEKRKEGTGLKPVIMFVLRKELVVPTDHSP